MYEWMAAPHCSRRSLVVATPLLIRVDSSSSTSSFEGTVVPKPDRAGPSGIVGITVSSDSSSRGDPNSPHCSDTPLSEGD